MRKILTAALAATSIVLAACGDSSGPPANITGTYTLETVNNAQLPATTSEDENYKAEILASAITLRADKTFTWEFTGRSTDYGQPTTNSLTFTGTYSVTGSTITLNDPELEGFVRPEGYVTATLSTDTITMVIEGPVGTFTLVFRR